MKEQDIDKLFRDAAESHKASPSPQLWDKIAQQLEEEKESEAGSVKIIPVIQKRTYAWIRYAAAACVLVGIGMFVYLANQQDDSDATNQLVNQQPTKTHKNELTQEMTPSNNAINTPEIIENTDQSVSKDRQIASTDVSVKNEKAIKANSEVLSSEQKRIAPVMAPVDDLHIAMEEPNMPMLPKVQLADVPAVALPTRFVTDVEPVKPLIEPFDEEEEMMIAGTVRKTTNNVLNKIITAVNDNTPMQVKTDDEGSFRLDVGNLFAKNRTRKRK